MSFFPHKYIVTYGHCEKEFESYTEEKITVKAVDEKDAEDQVLAIIHSKYRFYKIYAAERKRFSK